MEYNFNNIEKKWQKIWADTNIYKVSNNSDKPKYYVLDMFPYPSGAGLHVGHPLGYIASDIYARYKRLKGFNVLHPMGYDAFGLPAEQYAIEHGIHPAVSTENNINTFRKQLDNIGFCYDWDREVRTSDPKYYKWTQWIFLQLFKSWFNRQTQKAEPIDELVKIFEKEGNVNHPVPNSGYQLPVAGGVGAEGGNNFTAEAWKNFDESTQQHILMEYRLAYCGYGEVNWCEALGTVLANDEVVNGVSERGGHPVVKKKLRQWYLRITEYADRLLKGLQEVDFSEAMKEMQTNWIGKSSGAEIEFKVEVSHSHSHRLTPGPSPQGEGSDVPGENKYSGHYFKTAGSAWQILKEYGRENRKNATEAEDRLWQKIRNNQLNTKVRRQHTIGEYIVDFAILEYNLAIEIDGEYHDEKQQQLFDEARTAYLNGFGVEIIRFSNKEVLENLDIIVSKIESILNERKRNAEGGSPLLRAEKGPGDEALQLRVYTTRPDTIFGVDFMVLAPEHDLVEKITTPDQKKNVDEYITYVKSRSDRERQSEKKITGAFTGAYAINPFNGKEIPVWISEYVLAGYGTGAIMAVPCGDERDHKFAQHFNIPITNIIGNYYNGQEANPTKDAILQNSDFINGMVMRDAIDVVITELETKGIGIRKTNYKMRDAAFSRQRYWGEPFPIIWKDGVAYPLDESELPLELPQVESYKPGPEGEGPLANIPEWSIITSPPAPLHGVERGVSDPINIPKYNVLTPKQYELARMMRKEHTEAEDKLWQLLRNNQLGVKFRRQHPIDAYIVDFMCLQERLIVEVDGGYHESDEQKYYDTNRTEVLKNIGFEILRFTNDEVLADPFIIKEKIKEHIKKNKGSGSDEGITPLSTSGEGLGVRETNTMPGYAGSSWYFLRYMDPHNDTEFAGRQATDYWNQVDLYIGGTEHAVGHLLYSRLWTKVLHDLGHLSFDEPYKKLVNQGMIQGSSRFVYRLNNFGIENRFGASISEIDKKYSVVPCDFDDNTNINFDYRSHKEGAEIEWFIALDNYSYISKYKNIEPISMRGSQTRKIIISHDEFLHHFLLNDFTDWLESLLKSDKNYYTNNHYDNQLFQSFKKNWDELDSGEHDSIHVDVNLVDGYELDIEKFKQWRNGEYANAEFILEDGSLYSPLSTGGEGSGVRYICGSEVEKMSKSKFNTVNPDDLVNKYGADTFRMYEMFLGPVEMSKPWDTKGIEGVHRFLKKLWRLFYKETSPLLRAEKGPGDEALWTKEAPTPAELKALHKSIKRIEDDTERFSFNTGVSGFMILVNELTDLKCHKRAVLEPMLIMLAPYAPHIAEELWHALGNTTSVLDASYPVFEEKYVKESSKEYPISVNGKLRTTMNISLDATQEEVEKLALENEIVQKWLDGKPHKKIIFVKNKMVNVVV